MKVHHKEQLTEEELRLRRQQFQDNFKNVLDFLKEWAKNTGLVIVIILGALFILGTIGFPIYLVCSGLAARCIWKMIVGIVWLFIVIGFSITLQDKE